MSLAEDGVWKSGVWAQTVWADDVWREGAICDSGLVLNGCFIDWADPTYPDDWVKVGAHTPGSYYVEESPANSMRLYSVDGTGVGIRQDAILIAGTTYNYELIVSAYAAGFLNLRDFAAVNTYGSCSSVGTYAGTFVSLDAGITLFRAGGVTDVTLASIRIWAFGSKHTGFLVNVGRLMG